MGHAVELVELEPARHEDVALVLADAFLDDPGWLAVGPSRERARLRLLRSFFRVILRETTRHGGPIWCAVRDGEVVGTAVAFADGRAYPPPRATLAEGPPFLLAGPAPAIRGAWIDAIFKRRHMHEPHLYLWQLAVHPDAQRQGVGRALMGRILEDAEAAESPAYLETTKPENVPYYGSFGFRVVDEADLLRGAHVWFMLRERPEGGRGP